MKIENEKLRLYRTKTRFIKVKRFFELKEYCDKFELWDSVKAEFPHLNSEYMRIEIDTLLLNAVKIAVLNHVQNASLDNEDLKTAERTIYCAERIHEANQKDKEREAKERDETCKAHKAC